MNKQQINGATLALGAAERSPDERSETGRSGAAPTAPPDPEVRPLAKRRRFTAQYKLKILAEADAATASGAIGALLRREGLYSSMLANWRKERATGMEPRTRAPQAATGSVPQGSPPTPPGQRTLDRTSAQGRDHHRRSKKVASLLGRTLATPDPEDPL